MKTSVVLIGLALAFYGFEPAQFMNADQNRCSSEIEVSLDEYKWKNRLVVLFARDAEQDHYQLQLEKFESYESGIKDRDLLFISILEEGCSKIEGRAISDKSADTIQKRLNPRNKSFRVVLIGKDGTVKLQREQILNPDELFRIIDQMPMRRREMKNDS